MTSTSVALILVLGVLGYLGYEERLRQGRRLTAALARVDALGTAQTQALPIIVRQLAPDVELVRDRLERMAAGNGSNRDSRRLPAALALLGVDPGQAGFLTNFILSGEPGPAEVLVVRAALDEAGSKDGIDPIRKLLDTNPAELSDVQLRAAGMLAVLDRATAARNELAAPLARKLVTENPLLLGTWSEVFQPVSRGLIKPLLALSATRADPSRETVHSGFSSSLSTVPIMRAMPKTSPHCWATPIQIERIWSLNDLMVRTNAPGPSPPSRRSLKTSPASTHRRRPAKGESQPP